MNLDQTQVQTNKIHFIASAPLVRPAVHILFKVNNIIKAYRLSIFI